MTTAALMKEKRLTGGGLHFRGLVCSHLDSKYGDMQADQMLGR